jgi:hypothetical protein
MFSKSKQAHCFCTDAGVSDYESHQKFNSDAAIRFRPVRHDDHLTTHLRNSRKDKRGFDLISDVLPFGRLW